MASKLDEFRQQYPEYADWGDEQLLQALHQKHYADLDFADFEARMTAGAAPAGGSLSNNPLTAPFVGAARHAKQATQEWIGRRAEREPGVPELSSVSVDWWKDPVVGTGFFLTPDTQAQADVASRVYGADQYVDDDGYHRLRLPAGRRDGLREVYVNAPGPSLQDALTPLNEAIKYGVTGGLAGMAVKRGLARAATQGAAASGTSVAGDLGAMGLGSEQGVDPIRALLAGGFAGVGDAFMSTLARPAGRAIERVRGVPDTSADDGLKELMGIGAQTRPANALDDIVVPATPTDAQAAARQAAAVDMGVPTVTKGQMTRNRRDLADEHMMLDGSDGDEAASIMARAAGRQRAEVTTAGHKLTGYPKQLAGDTNEAGALIRRSLDEINDGMKAGVSDAYTQAAERGASLPFEYLSSFPDSARRSIANRGLGPDMTLPGAQEMYKKTHGVLEYLDSVRARMGSGKLPLSDVEEIRKVLVQARQGADPADARNISVIIDQFDQMLDDVASMGSLGDDAAAEAYRHARGAHAERMGLFGNAGRDDYAGKAVETILGKNGDGMDMDRVIGSIFGPVASGTAKGAPQTARRMREILETRNPEAFQALREAYVHRLMKGVGDTGTPGAQTFSYGKLVNDWDAALNGTNREVTEALFDPPQIESMQRYLGLLRILNNPMRSPSAPGILSRINQGLANALGFAAAQKAGPAAGVGARAVTGLAGRIGAGMKANRHIQGVNSINPGRPVVAPLAAAAVSQDRPPLDDPPRR